MSAWTDTADEIERIVGTFITPANVTQGYTRYGESDNWYQSVVSLTPEIEGYFRFALDRIRYEVLSQSVGTYYAELAVYIPKDTSSDMHDAWDLANSIGAALTDQSNYTKGAVPTLAEVQLDRVDVLASGGIAYFLFGRPGSGGLEFIDP